MSAALYTAEEEQRYKLPALPSVPFIGTIQSGARRALYEAQRKDYRSVHPIIVPDDEAGITGTRTIR